MSFSSVLSRLPRRHRTRSAWRPLACLAALLLWLWQPAAGALAAGLHLTAADTQQVEAGRYTAAPANVDSATLPAGWRPVTLPYAQPADVVGQARAAPASVAAKDDIVTTWYRLAAPRASGGAPEMLYSARLKAYGPIAVYVDGQLRYQRQLEGPTWYWMPLWLELSAGPQSAPPREILFRMQHPRGSRTALASVWLGSSDEIGWRYQGRQWQQVYVPLMSIGAFVAVGVFSAFVWIWRGVGKGYGLFTVLATAQFLRSLSFFSDARMANDWLAWLMLNSLFWMLTLVHAFQVIAHGRRQRWLSRSLIAISAVVGVLTLPVLADWPNTPLITPVIYLLAMPCGIVIGVAGVAASRGRSAEGMWISVGVVFCVLYGINDWALQSNFLGPEAWYLGPYMNMQNFGMMCYLMYRRYIGALKQVEDSNAQLAQRLREREAELASSYERLIEIEHKQTIAGERMRLMQDMHDGLGSSLQSALWAVERGQLADDAIPSILRACIDDLHLTIDSLEPVEADLLLLLATLRYRLGERLRVAGMQLHWAVVDVPPLDWIDPRTALHILRILQEALSNIVKHANASEIRVATGRQGVGVTVSIDDNGQGFDHAQASQHGGKGLLNQRRRAAAIGAAIAWEAAAGGGTRVVLWLPLSQPASSSGPLPAPGGGAIPAASLN